MVETLTNEQVEALLDIIAPDVVTPHKELLVARDRCLVCVMVDAGLRVGEATKLLKSDLLFNDIAVSSICVRAAIAKTKQERYVPTTERLRQYVKTLNALVWTRPEFVAYTPAFFSLLTGLPIQVRTVQYNVQRWSWLALGREISPHALRHTFADRLRKVTDIRTLQTLLGHKQLSSTQIYLHPNGDDRSEAIKAMEAKKI